MVCPQFEGSLLLSWLSVLLLFWDLDLSLLQCQSKAAVHHPSSTDHAPSPLSSMSFLLSFRQWALRKTAPKLLSFVNNLAGQGVTFWMSCECRVVSAPRAGWPGQLLVWPLPWPMDGTSALLSSCSFVPNNALPALQLPTGNRKRSGSWSSIFLNGFTYDFALEASMGSNIPKHLTQELTPKSTKMLLSLFLQVNCVHTLQICSGFPAPFQMQLEFALLMFLLQVELTWPWAHDTWVTTTLSTLC